MTQTNYKSIKEWRDDEKPRERLIKFGAENLSDAEILAILISSGTQGFSALDIARYLLDKYDSLNNLARLDYSHFKATKGIGTAKAIILSAAFELSRRVSPADFSEKKVMSSPQDVANYFIQKLKDENVETFRVLLLNSSNQIFREVIVSKGSINLSVVHPREVFKVAISESAVSIILLHNHPSGNPTPSKEDIKITKQLVEAGNIINIKVIDHIIIAGRNFYSFLEHNLIES